MAKSPKIRKQFAISYGVQENLTIKNHKTMSNIPAELKYSNDHEWCRVEGEYAYVGITDFAQSELGDIVFVDIQTEGETLAAGE